MQVSGSRDLVTANGDPLRDGTVDISRVHT